MINHETELVREGGEARGTRCNRKAGEIQGLQVAMRPKGPMRARVKDGRGRGQGVDYGTELLHTIVGAIFFWR